MEIMIYLDLKQQKRTLEPNEFTIDASSEEAKAFFTPRLPSQELVIDLENKTTYFEEYELKEDGTRYSRYKAKKVDGKYVPDMEKINETNEAKANQDRKTNGEDYNGFMIPFKKDDADGLMQVKAAFGLGITDTVIHFSNGTKMPMNVDEFAEFAVWFVNKRNEFFMKTTQE
jgi:hypothetical protein